MPTPAAPAASRRRAAFAAVAVVALVVVAVACTRADAGANGPGGAPGEEAAAGPSSTAPTTTQPPDVIADPGVAPGTCGTVTYTPPTAAEAFEGELCRPAGQPRDVAVVLVHGGGGISGTPLGMKPWADRLGAEGYVTFAPEYHLFDPFQAGPVFPRPEQNLKAAVQYLRGTANALGILRSRIAVEGFSAGARLGAVAFTTPDDPWFAGPELWPGLSDEVNAFAGFYHPLDGSMQHELTYYGGPSDSYLPATVERWEKGDSLAHVDQARGPAVIITGSRDWDIQVTQGQAFVDALVARGFRSQLGVVQDGGHGFDQGDGTRLTRLGEQSATFVLVFLNQAFPQTPAREPQVVPPDLDAAPDVTGLPPTTYVPRPSTTWRSAPSTTARRNVAPSTTWRTAPSTTWRAPSTTARPVTPTTPRGPSTTARPTPSVTTSTPSVPGPIPR